MSFFFYHGFTVRLSNSSKGGIEMRKLGPAYQPRKYLRIDPLKVRPVPYRGVEHSKKCGEPYLERKIPRLGKRGFVDRVIQWIFCRVTMKSLRRTKEGS